MLTEKEIKDAIKKIDKGETVCFYRAFFSDRRTQWILIKIEADTCKIVADGIFFEKSNLLLSRFEAATVFATKEEAINNEIAKKLMEFEEKINIARINHCAMIGKQNNLISSFAECRRREKKQPQRTVFVLVCISALACAASVACSVSSFI